MWSLAQFLDYHLEEMYKHAMDPTYDRFELANDIRKLRNSLMKPEKTVVDGNGEIIMTSVKPQSTMSPVGCKRRSI